MKKKQLPDDEELIPWRDVLPPLLDEAIYTATIEQVDKPTRKCGNWKIKTTVCLRSPDKAFGVRLPLWFNLGPEKTIGAKSKLASALRMVSRFCGLPAETLPPAKLKDFYYRVRVRTVRDGRDDQNRPHRLPEHDWHSVVARLEKLVGKRTELPPECHLPKEQL